MENQKILSHVDHTFLSPVASWAQIAQLCSEAAQYKTASVCVPPSYVGRIAKEFPALNICTVIGFPLGYSTTSAKVAEVEAAISEGACEVDMVVNLGDVKNGAFNKITGEIRALKQAAAGRILKVIIEACCLTQEEKIALCHCVTEAGADYIKTSTGFGTAGATMEDVRLFKAHIGPHVKIKAAGGIRSRQDMADYLAAGCDRLGTSSAIKILAGESAAAY